MNTEDLTTKAEEIFDSRREDGECGWCGENPCECECECGEPTKNGEQCIDCQGQMGRGF